MHWATTTWRVTETALGLTEAIEAWKVHCDRHHPQITGIRCYRYNGGTSYVWQEGFEDFHRYEELIEAEDASCAAAQEPVFRHAVPGSREGRIWAEVI